MAPRSQALDQMLGTKGESGPESIHNEGAKAMEKTRMQILIIQL